MCKREEAAMSYRPKPLTHYERGFVLGASFLSAGAFVLGGHKLLTGSFPLYTYVFFLATLSMCLGGILRYFIFARVFRTEKNLWAWSLSTMIAFLGPITVYQTLSGPVWFLLVVLLIALASLKTIQSKSAIGTNFALSESQKNTLIRLQVGISWFQLYIGAILFAFWLAAASPLSNYIAASWFGVSNLAVWTNGVSTVGGLICLLASGHVAVRILVWHREYVRMFLSSTTDAQPKVPGISATNELLV
jgi:hypothetical protein